MADLGYQVVGLDPARRSVAAARAHAVATGHSIAYGVAAGEALPFADAVFDVAYCFDVLEHVGDWEQVVAETARVLKPGGVFVYDTLNRTRLSRLGMIRLPQEWRATAAAWREKRHGTLVCFGDEGKGELGGVPRLPHPARPLGRIAGRRGVCAEVSGW